MKAILIHPASEYRRSMPSLGLAFLSSALKSHDHDVLILDLRTEFLSDEKLRNKIASYKPDFIGVTFYTIMYHAIEILTAKLKAWFPSIKIIVGGVHPSALPRETLEEMAYIDFVAIGEAEITIVEFIGSLKTNKFDQINGLAFRTDGKITINPQREYIQDLDSIPYPDLGHVSHRRYKCSPPYGWYGYPLTIITSRGCPYQCTFCTKSVYGNSFRFMSVGRVINEIKYWRQHLPIKEIRFYDDVFTLSKKRVIEICDALMKEKVNLPWTCTTRVDLLSKELLAKMKASGLYLISLGVEAGSDKVLNLLKKVYTVEHVRRAFKWCHELKIATLGFFLVGNPGETQEDRNMTFQLQREIKPNFVGWGVLDIYPGSQLFDQSKNRADVKLDKESGYVDFYRKDLDGNSLRNFCLKAMLKNCMSFFGIKSIVKYLFKTRNFSIFNDYLLLKFKTYTRKK